MAGHIPCERHYMYMYYKRGIWWPRAEIQGRECDIFHGENHFEMHTLDHEICLFENACFIQDYAPF